MFRMSREDVNSLKPFLSVFFIICSLFIVVFAKMEERRLGYAILKLTHIQRLEIEEKRAKVIQLAKINRPQHIEKVAQDRFTLKKVKSKQIIHVMGGTLINSSAENQKEL